MKRVQGLPFSKYEQLVYLCTTKHHDRINKNKIEPVEDMWELKKPVIRLSTEVKKRKEARNWRT